MYNFMKGIYNALKNEEKIKKGKQNMEDQRNMFEDARTNTEINEDKLLNFRADKQKELDYLVQQAVFAAKTELVFAQVVKASDAELSELALKFKKNPNYDLRQYVEIVQVYGDEQMTCTPEPKEVETKEVKQPKKSVHRYHSLRIGEIYVGNDTVITTDLKAINKGDTIAIDHNAMSVKSAEKSNVKNILER